MSAIVGAQTTLARTNIGFFPDGSPYASDTGMPALTGRATLASQNG
jgi:hypothetical protein